MVIVSYDISVDKLRTKFSKYLSRFGHRIQYSVFEIDNSKRIIDNIVNDLTNMGNEIYMSYYYPSVSSGKNLDETKEFLQKYETIGLKFNLTELEKYSEDFSNKIKNFKNGDKSCDKTNTMVIIYPTSPYGKNNYNVQVSLDCGFKATEEK